MPAQKRSPSENLDEEDEESMQQHCRRKQLRREDNDDPLTDEKELQDDDEQEEEEEEEEEDDDEEDEDSDGGVSDPDDLPEFVEVKLTDVRKDVECPICLGIIKKTRTVMECMHRFCRVCIDKAMRLGNNECPACRTHCASRRSLRDDPRYDAMIACIFPDIKKYEEEELAFYEEEKTRNKQIQESIAQIFRRQSEALVKRRTMGKDIAAESTPRLPRNYRNAYSRRKRNNRITEIQGSDDNEDENDQDPNKDSSSTDEHGTEIKQRRYKRRTGVRCTQPSPQAAADSSGGYNENETEGSKEIRGTSPGIAWNTEGLTWGGGGARSNTRHGGASGNKGNRSSRVSKLVEYIQNLKENDDELDVHLKLISLDKQRAPRLELPHLCCHSSLSVKHLCHYIAQKTRLQAEDFEMLLVKDTPDTNGEQSTINASTSMDELNSMWQVIGGCKSGLQILEGPETLARLKDNCIASRDHLILAYRQKESKQQTDDKLL